MTNKAVFVDRDDTLIEDVGYISDPADVKLLPGVELAIKSLRRAGYLIVVVTNQSGVARGKFTVEQLERVNNEMCRKLEQKGTSIDGLYYCPFHPDGTVEPYARESDLRKPAPGMLMRAAEQMDIDLSASWMVGDSPRDVEAGRRAGCRTIWIRHGDEQADDPGADYAAKNLVEAARIIMKSQDDSHRAPQTPTRKPASEPHEDASQVPAARDRQVSMDDSQVRREILRLVRQLVKAQEVEEFSLTKLIGGVVQVFALLSLLLTFWKLLSLAPIEHAMLWAQVTIALQVMSLTFFMMRQRK